MHTDSLEIYLATAPGLEHILTAEAQRYGFPAGQTSTGGVSFAGSWQDAWRANLMLRGASHVLVRLGSFRALHLAQLDKRARKFPWHQYLRDDQPVRVEVSCKKSRIYHSKAAAERIERAISEETGITISADAALCLKVRIADDTVTISVDTSGAPLHKRGHKQAVNKAPMRENLAALLLYACGYTGTEPVIDPMCGSGTFILEAAEIAAGFYPGRTRSFAFEKLRHFDADAWQEMKMTMPKSHAAHNFYGFDRDSGAVQMSEANAQRASVDHLTHFDRASIGSITRPHFGSDTDCGLVIINPPYGIRIGERKKLFSLYRSIGQTLLGHFGGWRVGIVTYADELAKATGLPYSTKPLPFLHGGTRVKLFQTNPLP